MIRPFLLLPVAALGLAAGFALAQTVTTMDHSAHAGHGGDAPSTVAFRAVNDAMHSAMAIDFTGDADIDFALGMIPHHEGAVAMARVVLEHGKDPEISALAEAIVAAQEQEIGWMRNWLKARGH